VRVERVTPGRRAPARLVGAVLARDLKVADGRWSKGRRLSEEDLVQLAEADFGDPISVLVLEAGEMHEDEAAARLADAVAGRGLTRRGPIQSRIDLLAAHPGVLNVDVANLERINRIDPLEVFTGFDGQIVDSGDLVASVKVAPHVVPGVTVEQGARIAGFGSTPVVWVAPFVRSTVGVVVKQSVHGVARDRFEASVHAKIEGLGSQVASIRYVEDDPDAVERALHPYVAGRELVDLVLTAGAASTDPADAFFVAIERLGGRLVRRGVPAHPGSMLWLARVGTVPILGLPTCGAYSRRRPPTCCCPAC
jgi:hypothetical protein